MTVPTANALSFNTSANHCLNLYAKDNRKIAPEPKSHLTFKNARRIAYALATVASIYPAIAMYPLLKYAVVSPHVSESDIQQLQNKTFDAKRIRSEQFENYRNAFKAENGRWPDPQKFPEDAEEYYNTLKGIEQTSDEDLKI